MTRYIDADIAIRQIDKLQDSLASNNDTIWNKNKPIYKGLCNARGIINDTPTADVVHVVRCKDCQHGQYMASCDRYMCRKVGGSMRNADDYCNYGERSG